jgi:hypothetical protein
LPKVIDPNNPRAAIREVSEAEYAQQVETSGAAYKVHEDGVEKVRLWDNVQGGWVGPFSKQLAYDSYLSKMVNKCSACTFTGLFGLAEVGQHIENVIAIGRAHRGATLKDVEVAERAGIRCSACETTKLSVVDGQKHIAQVHRIGQAHESGAHALTIMMYSLVPTEPPTPTAAEGPVVNQVERTQRQRHRSRGRRGKGRVKS